MKVYARGRPLDCCLHAHVYIQCLLDPYLHCFRQQGGLHNRVQLVKVQGPALLKRLSKFLSTYAQSYLVQTNPRPFCFSNLVKPMRLGLWPAPGFVDTRLSQSRLPFELHRTHITDRQVSAFGIVEALNVVEHTSALASSRVRYKRCSFGLERGEEALHRRVVPDIAQRLIEQTTPWSAISRWNCSLLYWLPRSE